MKRETVDDTNWITTTRLTWQIESVSLTIQAYHNVEKQFRALTDKHFVTLTDEEVVKMEQLLETLKRIRNTTYIKCQMCNNGIQSFVVKGGEMDGFAVCETCALSIKE